MDFLGMKITMNLLEGPQHNDPEDTNEMISGWHNTIENLRLNHQFLPLICETGSSNSVGIVGT